MMTMLKMNKRVARTQILATLLSVKNARFRLKNSNCGQTCGQALKLMGIKTSNKRELTKHAVEKSEHLGENKRKQKKIGGSIEPPILVRVFITDLILRHSAEVVETYSQSTENACVYKEFCNTKGI